MTINTFFKNCEDQEKEQFRTYFDKKLEHLEALFATVGVREIDLTLERFVKKSAYKVTMHAQTDHGSFMASEDDHTIAEALDFAKDKLAEQLRRVGEKVKRGPHGTASSRGVV